jgi:putative endonuclease
MYFLYILYSPSFDKFYTGISKDPYKRLLEHNSSPYNTFTSKYRPWELFLFFEAGPTLSFALKLEKKIKKQKRRDFFFKLKDPSFRESFIRSAG